MASWTTNWVRNAIRPEPNALPGQPVTIAVSRSSTTTRPARMPSAAGMKTPTFLAPVNCSAATTARSMAPLAVVTARKISTACFPTTTKFNVARPIVPLRSAAKMIWMDATAKSTRRVSAAAASPPLLIPQASKISVSARTRAIRRSSVVIGAKSSRRNVRA